MSRVGAAVRDARTVSRRGLFLQRIGERLLRDGANGLPCQPVSLTSRSGSIRRAALGFEIKIELTAAEKQAMFERSFQPVKTTPDEIEQRRGRLDRR